MHNKRPCRRKSKSSINNSLHMYFPGRNLKRQALPDSCTAPLRHQPYIVSEHFQLSHRHHHPRHRERSPEILFGSKNVSSNLLTRLPDIQKHLYHIFVEVVSRRILAETRGSQRSRHPRAEEKDSLELFLCFAKASRDSRNTRRWIVQVCEQG
jgi:hypothetical protein